MFERFVPVGAQCSRLSKLVSLVTEAQQSCKKSVPWYLEYGHFLKNIQILSYSCYKCLLATVLKDKRDMRLSVRLVNQGVFPHSVLPIALIFGCKIEHFI